MNQVIYTVRPGNTVFAIAQFFGTTAREIANANALVYPYTIFPGQQLVIPIEEITAPSYSDVRPGDSLFSIASRYDLDPEDLLSLNDFENPNVIYPGQIIRLSRE